MKPVRINYYEDANTAKKLKQEARKRSRKSGSLKGELSSIIKEATAAKISELK